MSIQDLPASIGQRVLWQMDHHRGGHGALNCPLLVRLDGPLDVDALQAAIDAVARRHESLRTTFAGRGPRLRQLIHDEPLPIELSMSDAGEDPAALERGIALEVQTRADPEHEPVRARLWHAGPDRHVLCLTMHHLVTDGWSTAVICDELGRVYDRVVAGGPPLAPVGWQYREWAAWQTEQLTGDSLRQLQDYWRQQLSRAAMPPLPRRDTDVPLLERRTTVLRARVPADVVRGLARIARARGSALFTCLLAVVYALLAQEYGAGDFAVSSIFANRARPEAQSTVGFLSNMVVLRAGADPQMSFPDLVAALDEAVIGAFAHQALPFQLLPSQILDPTSQRADSVVFQLFAGPMAVADRAGVRFAPIIDVPQGIGSRWEFELSAFPDGDELALLLCFADDLYDAGWAAGFIEAFAALAERCALSAAAAGTAR
ncbi:MAG: condensation domain-containing protein [Solirubrobacteraceae bacterium]